MPLREFWLRVRNGIGLRGQQDSIDSRHLDPVRLRERLGRSSAWLTPQTVEGFDPDDFDFLPPGERDGLAENVRAFLAVARAIPADGSASPEQLDAALTPFLA